MHLKMLNAEGWLNSTVPACSTCEGIDDITVNHRSALLLETVVGLCLGRLVELAYQSLLVVMEAYNEAVAALV